MPFDFPIHIHLSAASEHVQGHASTEMFAGARQHQRARLPAVMDLIEHIIEFAPEGGIHRVHGFWSIEYQMGHEAFVCQGKAAWRSGGFGHGPTVNPRRGLEQLTRPAVATGARFAGLVPECPARQWQIASLGQRADAYAEQTQATRQRHALETLAGGKPDSLRVCRVLDQGLIARGDLEIIKTQLDANGLAHVSLSLQVAGDLLAQAREDCAQFGTVAHGVQVALEGGFAAHRHGLAVSGYRAIVAAPGGAVHPGPGALTEVVDQPLLVFFRQLADGVDTVALQLGVCLGANTVDLAASQRPDHALQVLIVNDGDAVGFVELAGHLGQQFVGRHTHRAGETSSLKNAFWISRASTRPPSRWPPDTSVKSM